MFNHTEWQRKRRRENPERDREYGRQYYWRHKDDPSWRERRRAYLKRYCQIHKENGNVRVFSRNLENMTEMFPEIVQAAAAHVDATSAIFSSVAGLMVANVAPDRASTKSPLMKSLFGMLLMAGAC